MEGGSESKSEGGSESTSEHTNALISLDAPVRLAEASVQREFDEYLCGMHSSLGPAYDLDPEFVSSREKMGAGCGVKTNRSKISIQGLTYDTAALGTRNDDIFDGDRKVVSDMPTVGKTSLKLLYTGVMGLENPPPDTASCEFFGAQGYLYKTTCALGAVYQ
jgi:hypothetical protein